MGSFVHLPSVHADEVHGFLTRLRFGFAFGLLSRKQQIESYNGNEIRHRFGEHWDYEIE